MSAHRPETGRGEWERAFLRAALAQVDATVVAFDPDGEIVLVSGGPAGTGVPVHRGNVRTSLIDIPLVQADGVTPLPASEAPAARVLRGERVSGVVFGVILGDGTVRFRRASGMPLVDDTGHSLGGLITMWDITHQRRAEDALRTQAFHDPLTGLPNRSLMLDRLAHALERSRRSHRPVTVLFVDLDRFKVVNDGMGHAAGDHVLVEMARRLTSSVRQTDTVARPGGDEFVVICEDLSESGVLEVAGRLLDAVGRPLEVDGQIVRMSCSIGVAVGDGQTTPEHLLSDADTALYRAKEAGRNRYELFDEQLRRQARRRLTIEQLLVRAIEQRALTLHLQPIVEAVSGRTVGAEALTRVRYGLDGKLLFPSDFLSIADDTGLLADIDAWAIAEACRIAAQWHAERGSQAPYIACNVSRRLLERGDFVSVVESALSDSGLPPALLRLELTEQALLAPSHQGEAALRQLAGSGVRIGLDDFCTGMSSLTHLRQHPVSFLKIDRSIVHELGRSPAHVDEALVDAVVRLGHALGLEVVAEGVETEEQAAVLRRLGCRLLQGFLLARPVPSRQARTPRQLVRG